MRYAEMDANGDGVITRSEWRDTRQAFDAADWNRDGVLSGIEVQVRSQSGARAPGDFDVTLDADNNVREDTYARFAYLDTNRDRRIERGEWRGTAASFYSLDRNGDNLLTMMELRGVAATTGDTRDDIAIARARFAQMDVNRDSVISVDEWYGSRIAFNREDVNRDGVVTRREFMDAVGNGANNSIRGTSGIGVNDEGRRAVATNGQFVRIDGRQAWTDSGVYVNVGDVLTFDAEGNVQLSDNQSDMATPDGARSGRHAEAAPLGQNLAGALIARIGNSGPFVVGSQKVMRATSSGRVMLGINDDYTDDNVGFFRVRIGVR
jgi:Ca2+-binding EF-hand superfamily protein